MDYKELEKLCADLDAFAISVWTKKDIEFALDEVGIEPSEENVNAVLKARNFSGCNGELADDMATAAWKVINKTIKNVLSAKYPEARFRS